MAHITYGYKIEDGRAVIDKVTSSQVITLYEAFITGASYRQCRDVSGIERTPKGCKAILMDRTYLGDDFYPPLIDPLLFAKAEQEMIRRGPGHGGRKKRSAMPVGTVFCLEEADGLITIGSEGLTAIHTWQACETGAALPSIEAGSADSLLLAETLYQKIKAVGTAA